MGKVPGMPDYVFMKEDGVIGIEFKTEKGKISSNQERVKTLFDQEKIPYYIVQKSNDALDILKKHGFIL